MMVRLNRGVEKASKSSSAKSRSVTEVKEKAAKDLDEEADEGENRRKESPA